MDVPISYLIYKFNPQAEYILTNAGALNWEDILVWKGPGEKPTAVELEAFRDIATLEIETQFYADQTRANSDMEAASIPMWATYTVEQADSWYETNIRIPYNDATTLSAMKIVIGSMITVLWYTIRMVLTLRNFVWSYLQQE